MAICPVKFRETIVQMILGLALLFLVMGSPGCGCENKAGPAQIERILKNSWRSYVRHYISPEGRVVIPERAGESISEAQAYALLRAVWANDPATFSRVYAWTWRHLSRQREKGDALLAWRWGQDKDGAWRVLDWNTATDGDLDYALALALAARRGWRPPAGLPDYAGEARRVLKAIWTLETVRLPSGELLLTPGNWHEPQPPYLLNPSYFSPAAYRILARLQPQAGWERLRDSTYDLLTRLARGLGGRMGVGLFPDWCRVDARGQLSPAPGRDTHFGWEAVRLPWRLALDSLWFQEQRATSLLKHRFLPFFQKEWQTRGRLAAIYSYGGKPLVNYESPVLYAGVLAAALAAGEQDFARQMAERILIFYRIERERAFFADPDNYYANNWAWLGLALYAGWVK
ncbi:MAG: glycosyl hydrolase family 8 [Syntrophales bacterium]|nr:glycosyl hydrolase family 8 [Syntrophales bacterium]